MAKKKELMENYLSIFSMRELSKLSGVDYSRIYHVSTGNRKDGFTKEEKKKLSTAILKHVNIALDSIGSINRITSID